MFTIGQKFCLRGFFGAALAVLSAGTAIAQSDVATDASEPVATADSAPKSVKPGINKSFLNKELDVQSYVDRFETESREIFRARQSIVDAIGLKPGDRIADVGTGTGLFVEPFSEAVGKDGWVFATDIAPKFLERVERLIEMKSLNNASAVLSGQDDVRLPPNSVDVLFVCDVYHHFEFPSQSLYSIFRAVRPGGHFVIIDFNRIPGESRPWLLDHVRAGKEVFRSEIEDAGFEFVEEVEIPEFQENYFLRFRRPGNGG
ncbi:class I SAM-dependent methyltransferase [Crateriforma conspicua]|uniref:class I SAM-dependent methyltransferase n=1 Tax=Crateriforma conspicua TaxID=2527996 RepID=UPI00118D28FD|nr:methyltransferase domain-containing protein [Crateriforma conspicua]QDV63847.1 Ubiquinone/menaquinone biosynthesis C-methyltransferase UbiE [Crateriforma conspicua]